MKGLDRENRGRQGDKGLDLGGIWLDQIYI